MPPCYPPSKNVTRTHQLVSATLQEHFQLDMTNRKYTAQDIWDVLVAASMERISIEMASQLLEAAPSGTMVRTLVKEMLQDMGQLADVEKRLNELLTAKLPRKLLRSKLPVAIDLTELPYHGRHAEDMTRMYAEDAPKAGRPTSMCSPRCMWSKRTDGTPLLLC